MSNGQPSYGLRFSETERLRFRVMAQRARTQEQVQWTVSGIMPGARVADIGRCDRPS